MKYKLVRDNGHGQSQEVMLSSDNLGDIERFCREKRGGIGDLGVGDIGFDEEELL